MNYHRLACPDGEGRRTLEKLIYSYLGDWIDAQRREQRAGVDGSDARLASVPPIISKPNWRRFLLASRRTTCRGRWKPLHEQPIGWEPDINDGVRRNLRPFMFARPLGARAAGACVLRSTPKNMKWDKDRGKEPRKEKNDFPWYWGWDGQTIDFAGCAKFDPTRWTGLHYTNAIKKAARQRASASQSPGSPSSRRVKVRAALLSLPENKALT